MIDFSILLEAYFDCRRHKRKTVGATEFEMNYMSNLVQLLDESEDGIELIGHALRLVIGDLDPGETRNAAHGSRIHGHVDSLEQTGMSRV